MAGAGRRGWLVPRRLVVLGSFDPPFIQTLVVLFARVLHDLLIGPEYKGSGVLPIFGIKLRVVNFHLVRDVPKIGSGPTFGEYQLVTMAMAVRVEPGPTVEIVGFDD